jgi:hypothetical protein
VAALHSAVEPNSAHAHKAIAPYEQSQAQLEGRDSTTATSDGIPKATLLGEAIQSTFNVKPSEMVLKVFREAANGKRSFGHLKKLFKKGCDTDDFNGRIDDPTETKKKLKAMKKKVGGENCYDHAAKFHIQEEAGRNAARTGVADNSGVPVSEFTTSTRSAAEKCDLKFLTTCGSKRNSSFNKPSP